MEEIKIGDYVRTKKGRIGKVIFVSNVIGRETPKYLIDWNDGKAYYISQVKDIKHNENIINLIKIGDYVNGYEVLDIRIPRDFWEPIELIVDSKCINFITLDELKTIVTKEQFESMQIQLRRLQNYDS